MTKQERQEQLTDRLKLLASVVWDLSLERDHINKLLKSYGKRLNTCREKLHALTPRPKAEVKAKK